jgi:hypothetical protein
MSHNTTKSVVYLLLSFVLCLSGCDNSVEGESTPSELLCKFYQSLVNNDIQALYECSPDLEKYPKAATSTINLFDKGYKFQKELILRFGENAWEDFTTIPSDRPNDRAEFMFKLPPKQNVDSWVNTIEIRIDGDSAYYNDPLNKTVEHRLYKVGNHWLVDIKYAASDLESYTKFNDRFASCIEESIKYIKEAKTIGDIRFYMAKKIGF